MYKSEFLFFGNTRLDIVIQSASLELIMEKVESIGSTDYIDASDLKIRRVGKNRKLFGKIIYKVPLNNANQVKAELFIKTGSGWNMLPYKIEKP